MCRVVSRVLPADVAAPAEARRLVRQELAAWGLGDLAPDVSLLVSELVTNVVKHARTLSTLTLCVADGVLEALVEDGAGHLPVPGAPGEIGIAHEGGRGLHLVDRLANEWGVAHEGDIKHVWFRLPVATTWRWRSGCPCGEEGHPEVWYTGSGRAVRAVPGPWDVGGTVTPLR